MLKRADEQLEELLTFAQTFKHHDVMMSTDCLSTVMVYKISEKS